MSEFPFARMPVWTPIMTALVLFALVVSCMPFSVSGGSRTITGTPFPTGGNGDWTINADTVLQDENLVLKGNLTVTSTGSLTLRSSSLTIDQSAAVEYTLRSSGQISLENSVIYARTFETSAALALVDSYLNCSGYYSSSGFLTARNSEINARAKDAPTGQNGKTMNMTLSLYMGVDVVKLSVVCAGGMGGESPENAVGGRGGDANVFITAGNIAASGMSITCIAGQGGKGKTGGAPPNIHGGSGGLGGNAVMLVQAGEMQGINLTCSGGNGGSGGNAADGQTVQANGGKGGNGGIARLNVTSSGDFRNTGGRLEAFGGVGGLGGNGGWPGTTVGDGGNGGNAGSGGLATLEICSGSSIDLKQGGATSIGGAGGAGGKRGIKGTSGGANGLPGNGGRGADGRLFFDCEGSTIADMTPIVCAGGNGGTGGQGVDVGGSGGAPGNSTMVLDSMMMAYLKTPDLKSRGGKGGSGGGSDAGTIGTGTNGGNSGLTIISPWDFKLFNANVECSGGDKGASNALNPTKKGDSLFVLDATGISMTDCIFDRQLDVFDGTDYVTLTNVTVNTPPEVPATLRVTAKDSAEVMRSWYLSVKITDGVAPIKDAVVQAAFYDNETVFATGQTDATGTTRLTLVSERITATATDFIGKYKIQAFYEGRSSTKTMVYMTSNTYKEMKILENLNPPTISFTAPEEKASVQGIVTITGTSSDPDSPVSIVEISIQNSTHMVMTWTKATDTSAEKDWSTWSFSWNSSKYKDGAYIIQARARDPNFYSDIFRLNLTSQQPVPPPIDIVVDAGMDLTVGEDQEVLFEGSIIDLKSCTVSKYEWDFGDGSENLVAQSPIFIMHVYTHPDAYTATFRIHAVDPWGRTVVGSDTRTITVEAGEQAPPPLITQNQMMLIAGGAGFAFVIFVLVLVLANKRRKIKKAKESEEAQKKAIEASIVRCQTCGDIILEPLAGCPRCTTRDMISVVKKQIDDAKYLAINVLDAESAIEEADYYHSIKDYAGAKVAAKKAEGFVQSLQQKYMQTYEAITYAEQTIGEIKALKFDVSKAESMLYHAKLALGRGDYDDAMKKAGDASREAVAAKTETLQKGVADRFEAAEKAIASARKKGVDIAEAEATLDDAKAMLNEGKHAEAREKAVEAEKIAIEQNELFTTASEAVRLSKGLVEAARISGKNIEGVRGLIKQSRSALETGAYAKAKLFAEDAEKVVKELYPECRAPVDSIHNAEASIADAKKEGQKVPKAEYFVKHARMAIEKANFENAQRYAEDARQIVEKLRKQQRQAIEIIQSFEATVENGRASGIDVTDADGYLKQARFLLQRGLYGEAIEYAREAEKLVMDAAMKMQKYTRATETIANAENAVAEAKKNRMDVSKADYFIKNAKKVLGTGELDKAEKLALDAIRVVEKVKKQSMQALDIIHTYEMFVTNAQKAGVHVEDAFALLEKSKSAVQKGMYGVAIGFARDAEEIAKEEIKKSQDKTMAKSAEELEESKKGLSAIHEVEAKATEAKRLGLDMTRAFNLVQEAKSLLVQGGKDNSDKAMGLAKSALEEVNKGMKVYEDQKKFADLISEFEQGISAAKACSIATDKLEMLVAELKSKAITEPPEVMLEATKPAMREMELLRASTAHYRSLQYELGVVHAKIEDARAKGVNVEEAEAQLYRGGELLVAHNYLESGNIIKKADEAIDRLTKLHYTSGHASEEIKRLEKKIADSKVQGLDVADAELILGEARGTLDSGMYEETLEHIKRATEALRLTKEDGTKKVIVVPQKASAAAESAPSAPPAKELPVLKVEHKPEKDAKIKKKITVHPKEGVEDEVSDMDLYQLAWDKIFDADMQLAQAKEEGLDVALAENAIIRAKDEVGRNEYASAQNLASEALQLIAQAKGNPKVAETRKKKDEALPIVEDAERAVNDGLSKGMALDEAEKMIVEAKAAFASGVFEDAIDFAHQAEKIVKKVEKEFAQVSEMLDSASALVGQKRRNGESVTELELMLANAVSEMALGHYTRVKDIIERIEIGDVGREAPIAKPAEAISKAEALPAAKPIEGARERVRLKQLPKCPECGQELQTQWKACPYCKKKLTKNCECGREVAVYWKSCPYCKRVLK